MGRSEYSENLFYTGLQQHSFNDALVYCFAVALSYWFTTAKLQIKVSAMECEFSDVNRWHNAPTYQCGDIPMSNDRLK